RYNRLDSEISEKAKKRKGEKASEREGEPVDEDEPKFCLGAFPSLCAFYVLRDKNCLRNLWIISE
ncbi:MAG TPA: hypothetical protein PLM06_13850, partial [Anaerolineae bacterium]|nr:hypothetical protein [Anaerolineae bacterium]